MHALGALGCPQANVDPTGEGPVAHRLRRLVEWVDHLDDLGVGALLLTPIFASSTHGYDTADPFRIDQRLGDDTDLEALLAACHDRGIHVVLDGVFNHVGRAFGPFADVLARGRDSDWVDWFRIDVEGDGPDGFAYDTFEGHDKLVALDHTNRAVLDWAVEVACHWLDRGIDGWRLDAAYAVPTDFWAAFADRVRERHPDAWLLGEVIHGDYAAFVEASHLDTVTQYELHKSVWSAIDDANLHELSWNLTRHARFCRTFAPFTFLGNHDVSRILTKLDDPAHLGHTLAVLFTVPGTPSIYYLDELAARGEKTEREGGDDAIRPPLPDSPDPVDDEQARTLDLYRHLIALRRARPWLDDATLEVLHVEDTQIQIGLTGDDHAIEVLLNIDPDEPLAPENAWHGIAGHGVGERVNEIPPGTWAILER
ncbi:alpha-amylase family glycosyl hydrolase [Euzebya sp.]|uniref:alpha-amylase family glycosyl hydrolase n=1 Tax=Euzebya sp. TaxID=1971409 RepID=UPI003513693C